MLEHIRVGLLLKAISSFLSQNYQICILGRTKATLLTPEDKIYQIFPILNFHCFLPENVLICQKGKSILCMMLRSRPCEIYSKEFSMDGMQLLSLQYTGRMKKLSVYRIYFITVIIHIKCLFSRYIQYLWNYQFILLCNKQEVRIPNTLPTAPVSGTSWKAFPPYVFHNYSMLNAILCRPCPSLKPGLISNTFCCFLLLFNESPEWANHSHKPLRNSVLLNNFLSLSRIIQCKLISPYDNHFQEQGQ